MKRMVAVGLLLSSWAAMAASAGVGVCWQQDTNLEFFIYEADGVSRLAQGSICQLIWTPAPTVSVVNIYRPLVPAGPGEVAVNIDGYTYGALAPRDGEIVRPGLVLSNAYTNGYVYTRVFGALSVEGILAGVHWGQGGLSPLLTALPTNRPPLPTDYAYSCIAASTNYVLPYAMTGGCEYVINPEHSTFNEHGGMGMFNVVANSELCEWSLTAVDPENLPPWVTVIAPVGATNGSVTVSYLVATNYMPTIRSLFLKVNGGVSHWVQQTDSSVCDITKYSWATAVTNISESGGPALVVLNTPAPCEWQVFSDVAWIEVTNPESWTNGSVPVSFDVAVNYAPYGRVGHLTVWDSVLTVSQEMSTVCSYTVQPESALVSRHAVTSNFFVQTADECFWTATSDVPWIEAWTPTFSASGTGFVYYSVEENTNRMSRSGRINVMGTVFTVNQVPGPGAGGVSTWFPILLEASTNSDSSSLSRY